MSEESGEDERSFEERLKAARSRQGLDAPPPASGSQSELTHQGRDGVLADPPPGRAQLRGDPRRAVAAAGSPL